MRKICILELLSSKRVQSFRSIREEEISNLITSINSKVGSAINLSEMLFSMTNSIVARTVIGCKIENQEAVVHVISRIVKAVAGFTVLDMFPSLQFIHVITGMKYGLLKLHKETDKLLEDIVKQQKAESEEGNNLLNVLLKLQANHDSPLTTDGIKAVTLDMLIGGTDTSATILEWAMSELMKNPRVKKKAQVEVRKVCVENGYNIKTNTEILVNIWAIGRDPNYWIDPEKFNPERFFDNGVDYKGFNFEFLPFGAGRRICPGIQLGIELTLAKLLCDFNWKLPNQMKPDDLDMTETFALAIRRKNQLYLIPVVPKS
ncbi:cytochrome P450 726A27-like [Euphorbia lathyris]|uniref:cytochrome P450 726A27-like n=1 Tax=Euphorbia lathyris TaxID=212925 RepID=UPI003313E1F0